MKLKKPLLLAMSVVVILALALILPTAAFGQQDQPNPNKPLNWATSGGNINNFLRDVDQQVGHSILVKELQPAQGEAQGSLVGHMTVQIVKFPNPITGERERLRWSTTELGATDPVLGGPPVDVFRTGSGPEPGVTYRIVEFFATFDSDGDGDGDTYFWYTAYDGGEPPKGTDIHQTYYSDDTLPFPMWVPMQQPGQLFATDFSNVQVHLGE